MARAKSRHKSRVWALASGALEPLLLRGAVARWSYLDFMASFELPPMKCGSRRRADFPVP